MVKGMKKHIITIAGRPGSGKSTTAKAVAEQLGFQHFSSGDLFRAIAKERGIDVLQANLSAEENAEIDHAVDGRLREMGSAEDQLVVDSRMAWHWMPFSFKVFLDLELEVAAQRILDNMDKKRRTSEHIPDDPAEYAETLRRRLDSETRRYKSLYDADPYHMDNYDLVIDTATNNIEETIALVTQGYQTWLQQ